MYFLLCVFLHSSIANHVCVFVCTRIVSSRYFMVQTFLFVFPFFSLFGRMEKKETRKTDKTLILITCGREFVCVKEVLSTFISVRPGN